MSVIRVSYSILSQWARGDSESMQRAIDIYLRKPFTPTRQMEEGSRYHKEWENEAKQTNKLPKVFGARDFTKPQFEIKKAINLGDTNPDYAWLQLVGVLDVLDGILGIDYKTGVMASQFYANSYQHKLYQILFPEMKRFEYHAYNQYTGETTMSICHLSQETLEDGLNFLLTQAGSFRAYLEQNDLVLI